MPRPARHRPERPRRAADEGGFTLVELLVAMVLLGMVLAAFAPAYYNAVASTGVAGQRATADGLAVRSIELLRSEPYSSLTAGSCTTTSSTTPASGGRSYSVKVCLSGASDGITCPGRAYDYLESDVTVSWTEGTQHPSVSQTSDIYPGGQGGCSASAAAAGGSTAPPPPTGLTAADATGAPSTSTIDLTWVPASTTPDHYDIYYNTSGNFSGTQYAQVDGIAGTGTSSYAVSGLGAGQQYCFAIAAVSSGGASSVLDPSTGTVCATTASLTGSVTCTVTQLSVTPANAMVNSQSHLIGGTTNGVLTTSTTSFSVVANVTGTCSGVTVQYKVFTGSGSNQTLTTVSTALTGTGGQLAGTAGTSTTVWPLPSDVFTAYVNTTAEATAQVALCQEHGSTGKCQ